MNDSEILDWLDKNCVIEKPACGITSDDDARGVVWLVFPSKLMKGIRHIKADNVRDAVREIKAYQEREK